VKYSSPTLHLLPLHERPVYRVAEAGASACNLVELLAAFTGDPQQIEIAYALLRAADAEQFGVRTGRWWRDQVEMIPELRSSTLLPLRDTQIANLLFLGFADNREFNLDGHRYLFRGQTRVIETDITSDQRRIRSRGVPASWNRSSRAA